MMVSVVIPALNEAAWISNTIEAVAAQPGPLEIIVVDGHSTDSTLIQAAPLAQVLTAPRGRACQMNAGWRHATGEILLFLHADTVLPATALDDVRDALSNPEVEAGTFALRFDRSHWMLRLCAWCANRNLPPLCFGDRALFVRRSTLEEVGGFSDLPLFEDLQMVRVLHKRGGFRFLEAPVTTAARRLIRNGILRQQLRNAVLWLFFLLGVNPARLVRRYPYTF